MLRLRRTHALLPAVHVERDGRYKAASLTSLRRNDVEEKLAQRSYIWWNIAGVVIAIAGFTVGSLRGTMGGGGAHTVVGAAIGMTGALIAFSAYVLHWHRRRRERG